MPRIVEDYPELLEKKHYQMKKAGGDVQILVGQDLAAHHPKELVRFGNNVVISLIKQKVKDEKFLVISGAHKVWKDKTSSGDQVEPECCFSNMNEMPTRMNDEVVSLNNRPSPKEAMLLATVIKSAEQNESEDDGQNDRAGEDLSESSEENISLKNDCNNCRQEKCKNGELVTITDLVVGAKAVNHTTNLYTQAEIKTEVTILGVQEDTKEGDTPVFYIQARAPMGRVTFVPGEYEMEHPENPKYTLRYQCTETKNHFLDLAGPKNNPK